MELMDGLSDGLKAHLSAFLASFPYFCSINCFKKNGQGYTLFS